MAKDRRYRFATGTSSLRLLHLLALSAGAILTLNRCSSDVTGESARHLKLISGITTADTPFADVAPVTVQVTDGGNNAVIGADVEFTILTWSNGYRPAFWLVGTADPAVALRPTEDGGIVRGHIGFSGLAGPVDVVIRVKHSSLADTVHLTIVPGNAIAVRPQPRDTALYAGAVVTLHAATVDQNGNNRSDPVTYQTSSPNLGLTSGGSLTAGSISRSFYLVTGAGFSDTGWVSIVPHGTFAAFETRPDSVGVVLANLDGSGHAWLQTIGYQFPQGYAEPGPSWTPDGSRLVYTVATPGEQHLVSLTVAVPGSAQVLIPQPPANLISQNWPSVSPDGQYVYFSGWVPGKNPGLWRVDMTGANPVLVGQATGSLGTPQIEWRPTVSPDGSQLAFVTATAGVVVKTMDIATKTYHPWAVTGQNPAWSSSTDQIAYVADPEVRVVDGDGANDHPVSPTGTVYHEGSITWSTDGEWLLVRGAASLELINVGSGLVLPLGFTTTWAHPAWRP